MNGDWVGGKVVTNIRKRRSRLVSYKVRFGKYPVTNTLKKKEEETPLLRRDGEPRIVVILYSRIPV